MKKTKISLKEVLLDSAIGAAIVALSAMASLYIWQGAINGFSNHIQRDMGLTLLWGIPAFVVTLPIFLILFYFVKLLRRRK